MRIDGFAPSISAYCACYTLYIPKVQNVVRAIADGLCHLKIDVRTIVNDKHFVRLCVNVHRH